MVSPKRRRELRQSLGSRVQRRAGTKVRHKPSARARTRLERLIRREA